MRLRKITIDYSLRYIPNSEQTREIKQNTIKNKATPRKETKNISQNKKNSLILWQHKDLVFLQNSICTIKTFVTHTII